VKKQQRKNETGRQEKRKSKRQEDELLHEIYSNCTASASTLLLWFCHALEGIVSNTLFQSDFYTPVTTGERDGTETDGYTLCSQPFML
jgi:hypothetical protein